MHRVAVIFFSATGTTAKLAEAVHAGAAEIAQAVSCRIEAADMVGGRFVNEEVLKLADATDALAFGSPTYMGGPAAQFKAFADATSDRWTTQRWADKVAVGFTTGSCANGDQGHTLAYFTILAAQHGMLWCGLDIPGGTDPQGRNRLGSQCNPSGLLTTACIGAATPSCARTTAKSAPAPSRRPWPPFATPCSTWSAPHQAPSQPHAKPSPKTGQPPS